MDILPNLIGEKEMLLVSDRFITTFGNLLNQSLANHVLNYMTNPEANPECVRRLDTLIGDRVRKYTFHKQLETNGVLEVLSKVNLPTLPYDRLNYNLILDNIKWLKDNINNLTATIDPRQKEDFKALLEEASDFDRRCVIEHLDIDYRNMAKRISSNSRVFYVQREAVTYTLANRLLRRYEDFLIAEKGCRYLKLMDASGLPEYKRGEF